MKFSHSMQAGAALACAGALMSAIPFQVYADPPPWAPAHGWRKKHDPNYVGYTGKKWDQDYGVVQGTCNRQAAGTALGTATSAGAAIGGAAGAKVGGGEGRQIAILVGTVVGLVLGSKIDAKLGIDPASADRACIGQSLELSGDKRSVRWDAPDSGAKYLLTPVSGFEQGGQKCRNYTLRVTKGEKTDNLKGAACRADDGTWRVVS